jgi:hypothetical protein
VFNIFKGQLREQDMKRQALFKRIIMLFTGMCLLLAFGVKLQAQDLDTIRNSSNIDLSQITDAFIRNMTLLDKSLANAMYDDETHQMMLAVIAKAGDISRYYRSGGGAAMRRKQLDQQENLKRRSGFSKADQAKLDELTKQIQSTDPDGMFGKARGDLSRSIGELQRCLGLYQTSDVTVMDIIRLVQEHLQYYQTAMGKYQ